MITDLNFLRHRNFSTWKFLDFQLLNFWVQFSLMINDLQWSFNTAVYRDYYWVLLDCNHDYRLEHFPTLKFYVPTLKFLSSIFINDQMVFNDHSILLHKDYYYGLVLLSWIIMMISDLNISMVFKDHSILQRRDYYFLIMDYNHDIDFFFLKFFIWCMARIDSGRGSL